MGRPRKTQSMSDVKKEIIARLIDEYDIKSAADIQDALRDLLGETIQGIMESEMETQKAERQTEDPAYRDSRNGYKPKTLRSNYGPVEIQVPQDRNSDYEPQIVPKYSRDISEIDEKIIKMYARGMTTRQISDEIKDIYGFEVSEALVTSTTNKILPEIEAWQKRPLSAVYPIVYIDAIVFNVRDNGIIRKQAVYVVLGISEEGHKEVLSITIGENESAKFWLSVLNELKNRGVRDIFVLCADGLSGIGDAISAAFPMTEYQRCIVHMVRNTLKYVADKDKKEFAADLKTIYHAPNEEQGFKNMQAAAEKWNPKYPKSMDRWMDNWAVISPMFKFSETVRRVIYTTNAIESLNSGYRRLNRSRNIFPDNKALTKALYLATDEITKKWTNTLRDWGRVYAELSVMYPGRFS